MDEKIEIKEEPVWLEGTDSNELVSKEIYLKEEIKSELEEPGQTQISADIKDEIFIEEHTVGELVSCINKEDNVEKFEVFTRAPVDSCGSVCKVLETGSELFCHSPTGTEQLYHCKRPQLSNLGESIDWFSEMVNHETQISLSGQRPQCYNEYDKTFPQKGGVEIHNVTDKGDWAHPYNNGGIRYSLVDNLFVERLCNDCGKRFVRKENLTHVISYTGEALSRCNKCSEAFALNSLINEHKLDPTGQRPFRCKECNKAFSQKRHLKNHALIHTGDRPHQCEVCGTKFAQKGNLWKHMVIHTGQRPHLCSQCGKTFSQKYHFDRHMKIHTGERSHSCTKCGKMFYTTGNLKRHMLTHTFVRPYHCNRCGIPFSQKRGLSEHKTKPCWTGLSGSNS